MKRLMRTLRQRQVQRDIEQAHRNVARISRDLADLISEKQAAIRMLADLKLLIRSI